MIKTMIQHAKKHPGDRIIPLLKETIQEASQLLSIQLIPQFVFMGLGITGATFYLVRLAKGPHVSFWDKKNNPEPWNKLDPTYQYKFVAINTDYKNLKKDGPDF